MPTFRPCRHLFTDGHQCGSPALRGEPLCFNHHSARRPLRHQTVHGYTAIALPEPLDLHAVQRGLAELLRLTAAQRVELPLAQALHRQLALASQNLARIDRADARAEARNPDRQPVTDYTNHPTLGTLALEPEPQPQPGAPGLAPETWVQPDLQTQPLKNEDLETPLATQSSATATPAATPCLACETAGAEAGAPAGAPVGAPASSLASPAETATPTLLPTLLPTQPDLQTQTPSNQDLETSRQAAPHPPLQAPLQAPLPDPVFRFTLPPVLENCLSQQELDAANRHYAQALEHMAEGIYKRAQSRARLHETLRPFDDTEADTKLLDFHPQLQPLIDNLQLQDLQLQEA